MAIVIHLSPYLRRFAGGAAEVALDGGARTVGEALASLYRAHPGLRDRVQLETGEVRPHVNVFVGGESIRFLDGLATPIGAGAELHILPAVSGGAP